MKRLFLLPLFFFLMTPQVFAIPPQTVTGPVPALAPSYPPGVYSFVFTLTNYVPLPLDLSVAMSPVLSPGSPFSITNDCNNKVPGNGSCRITLTLNVTCPDNICTSYAAKLSLGVVGGRRSFTFPIRTRGRISYLYSSNSGSNDIFGYLLSEGSLMDNGSIATGLDPLAIATIERSSLAFVVNRDSDDISTYRIAADGTLTNIATTPAGDEPRWLVVNPSATFLYVVNADSSDIYQYSINNATGVLTPVGTPLVIGGTPSTITMNRAGTFAYVARDGFIVICSVNQSTGALTQTADSPYPVVGIAESITLNSSGTFAFVPNFDGNVYVYSIDQSTGGLAPASPPAPAGNSPQYVALNPAGTFAYVADVASTNIFAFSVNTSTGVLTSIAGSPFIAGSSPRFVLVDPTGTYVYSANNDSDNITGYSIASDGALIELANSPYPTGSFPVFLAIF